MRRSTALFVVACMCLGLTGCESLVRKFSRKPSEPPKPQEMVLAPQEYAGQRPENIEMYEQYYLFWRNWHEEFIDALEGTNRKRQVETVNEAIKNLTGMRSLLNDEGKAKLDAYVRQLEAIRDGVSGDSYGTQAGFHAAQAEKLKRQIIRDFSGRKVKGELL
ncbi:MAG: hypothetical protein ACM3OC_05040 [Deltaproteobacteria bacterium]